MLRDVECRKMWMVGLEWSGRLEIEKGDEPKAEGPAKAANQSVALVGARSPVRAEA
jgi:hypothetical protein